MSIDFNEEMKKYEQFLALDKLQKVVKMPASLFPEEITATIPSINMGTDGPTIVSLFLLSPHYLCEIDLQVHAKVEQVDFVRLDSIVNYRIELSQSSVKKADGDEILYQVAKLLFWHGWDLKFHTQINYVGFERDEWFKTVTDSIPISVMT